MLLKNASNILAFSRDVLLYKEFVFDLREAAAVWNHGDTDTTEGELVSQEAWHVPW